MIHIIPLILCGVGGFGVGWYGGWKVLPWFYLALLGMVLL